MLKLIINSCVSCHINPEGSGLRNENGWGLEQIYLPYFSKNKNNISEYKIGNIYYGSDLRLFYLRINDSSYIFPMQANLYLNYKLEDIDIYAKIGLRGIYEAFI
ncbi:MAG: hypothetical protein ABIL52_02820 [candidate division WOR-3 bacterium]